MPIPNGSLIGPYEIVGWLGAGGMGEVYRARDPRFDREVAIKVIPAAFATDSSRLRRFEQEARSAGQLNHPNVLTVYDVGMHDGRPYIVSELLDGESLRTRLEHGALPLRRAIDFARQTASGLAAVHDKGIVHRDLKPDNLFITRDGRLKILDFGIAKLAQPDSTLSPGSPTDTSPGTVFGTPGYMSPEQVRGGIVDSRSDIFSFGTIVYEMLTGRAAFKRETTAETMAAILKEEPVPVGDVTLPPAIERIVSRCLEKTRESRFQSAQDLAFSLEGWSGTAPATAIPIPRRRWSAMGTAGAVLGVFLIAAGLWSLQGSSATVAANPFENATFTRLTDWVGTETTAEISPDGRFVAFLSDRDGRWDLFSTRIDTGHFVPLSANLPPLLTPGNIFRTLGFLGDGAEIWFSPQGAGSERMRVSITGGMPKPLLGARAQGLSWSPDNARLVYFGNLADDLGKACTVPPVRPCGDPLFLADRTGADPRRILSVEPGMHNHNPVWSPDGQWIYFARGAVVGADQTDEMDIWRMRPSGESLERVTHRNVAVHFLAPLNNRTILYVAPDDDRSGPWLWSLDVESRVSRRVNRGVEQYASVSASRDGRRVVVTLANSTTGLWRVPLTDRGAGERDVELYPLPTVQAVSPRFGGQVLFYVSAGGASDGLWRVRDDRPSQVWRGADGRLSGPAAPSPDGTQVAMVLRREGKRHLAVMSAEGTGMRTLAASIEPQGTPDWSPDGDWIVVGGKDPKGPALFKIAVDSGAVDRLIEGDAINPAWSRDDLIVYTGTTLGPSVQLRAIRPDGSQVTMPPLLVRIGSYRFLPTGKGLVYLRHPTALNFELLDLVTLKSHELTNFTNQGQLRAFDITADGKHLVFDRTRRTSDVVLIELPEP